MSDELYDVPQTEDEWLDYIVQLADAKSIATLMWAIQRYEELVVERAYTLGAKTALEARRVVNLGGATGVFDPDKGRWLVVTDSTSGGNEYWQTTEEIIERLKEGGFL